MIYRYNNIITKPDLATSNAEGVLISGIHYDILNSNMSNTSLQYCYWDEEMASLSIYFDNYLSFSDKAILDGIIENY